MRDLISYDWPTRKLIAQIQRLTLNHNFDYRGRLLPNKKTGVLEMGFAFTLKLHTKTDLILNKAIYPPVFFS